jgi:hypothetical protein
MGNTSTRILLWLFEVASRAAGSKSITAMHMDEKTRTIIQPRGTTSGKKPKNDMHTHMAVTVDQKRRGQVASM